MKYTQTELTYILTHILGKEIYLRLSTQLPRSMVILAAVKKVFMDKIDNEPSFTLRKYVKHIDDGGILKP